MKKILYFLISIFLISCQAAKIVISKTTPKEPKPSDYWSLVRTHPILGFDNEAYFSALDAVSEIKNSNISRGPEHELDWRLEGPANIGGRIDVIKPLSRGSDTLFVGTANGGIFRSFDAGTSWHSVFDIYGCMSIGTIEVDPTNSSIIYAGTGDRNFGGGSFMGNGLYKSTDYGDTWTNIGLGELGIITSCSINPSNSQQIVIGALGNPFQKTNNRGIYLSNDGGQTWSNTLFVSDSSGITEIIRNNENPQILFASSFNRVNLPNRSIAKGLDSKIFKSIDGGQTWNQLTTDLPLDMTLSRVGVNISESNPSKIIAVYVGEDYNVYDIYVSENNGENWTSLLNSGGLLGLNPDALGGFGWYFGKIYIDPWDENHFILPGVEQFESFDGGYNWTLNVPEWWTYEVHADKHDLVFQDQQTMIIATDGGLYKTINAGVSWEVLGEIPITQFYDVNANTFYPTMYAGGAQDNGTTSGNFETISWNRDFGGDGFKVTYISETDHSVIYETQNAGLHWVDDLNGYYDISIIGDLTSWFTPYTYNLTNQTLFAGTNTVMKMEQPPFGFWESISEDLTQVGLGNAEFSLGDYHTISKINTNPFDENKFIVGTSDGLVWLGNLDGTYSNITQNLPEKFVTSVSYSKLEPNSLFVTLSGYYGSTNEAMIYKSVDQGQTWTNIASNLPAIGINALSTLVINNSEIIFIGTDGGVFVSVNNGQSWDLLGQNLPVATVASLDINIEEKRLIAGTFGRSMWSYDLSFWFSTISLNENSEEQLIMFPNPSEDFVKFNKPVSLLKIYNLKGDLIFEKTELTPFEMVNIEQFEDGTYILDLDGVKEKLVIADKK